MEDGDKETVYLYYAMHELKYSPSELQELYDAPRRFKALLHGLITVKLDQLEIERKEAEAKANKK